MAERKRRRQRVTSRYGFLCFLALVTVVLLVINNYQTWTAPAETVSPKLGPRKTGIKPEVPQPSGHRKELQKESQDASSITSCIFISEKNPFNPDRKEFPIATPAVSPVAEVKKPIVRPPVTLYGLTIAGDYRSATLSYPGRVLQKGEREVMTVKTGDRIGEYKVVKISDDRIKLETQEDNFEVLLYDARAPKKRVYAKAENKPPTSSGAPATPGAFPESVKPVPAPGVEPPRVGVAETPKPISPASVAAPSPPPSPAAVIQYPSSPSNINARTRRNQQAPTGELRYPPAAPPGEE
jgi:hypothetical protein